MATTLQTKPNLQEYLDEGNNSGFTNDEQSVCIRVDGRQYGIRAPSEQLFEQPIPPIFREIAEEIWAKSAILGLNEETVSKDLIFKAYERDLKLLQTYLRDFEGMAQSAIRRSIVCSKENGLSAEEQWKKFQAEVPLIGKDPLLKLSSDRAAKPEAELLHELKDEFEAGLIRVVTRMAFWLQTLVNNELVGILTWKAPDVCNYHYFLREKGEQVVGQEEITTSEPNGSDVPGEMMTATKRTLTSVRHQEMLERHTHHLVNATQWAPHGFDQRVPLRVAKFMESIPSWLLPHFKIITGQMTMEEIKRTKVCDKTVVTETVSVWKYDPAATFGGQFAMIGWTEEEACVDGGTHYQHQAVARIANRLRFAHVAIGASTILLVFGILIALGIRWHLKSQAKAAATYNAYVSTFADEKLYTTKKGELLILPGPPRQLRYAGIVSTPKREIRIVQGDTVSPSIIHTTWFDLPTPAIHPRNSRALYGDADLVEAGMFAKLRVVEASDDEIIYAIGVYQK